MRSKNLTRLARLTQGIALVGFGASELACAKDSPSGGSEPDFHINAPPTPTPSAPVTAPPAADAPPDAGLPALRLPSQLNAIPSARPAPPVK